MMLVFLSLDGSFFGLVNKPAEVAMERTVKIFKKGRRQAVRLPADFEFDTDSVYIRRDEYGNVVLSVKTHREYHRDIFLNLLKLTDVPESFLSKEERNQGLADRDPFEGM
jgi:antitoxin VapB